MRNAMDAVGWSTLWPFLYPTLDTQTRSHTRMHAHFKISITIFSFDPFYAAILNVT